MGLEAAIFEQMERFASRMFRIMGALRARQAPYDAEASETRGDLTLKELPCFASCGGFLLGLPVHRP